MAYACRTHSLNYNKRINDSPYHYVYGEHIDIKDLHPFWSLCYVYIPLKLRQGKLNAPRAYKAHFVGYNFSTIMFPNYLVVEEYKNGQYGQVRSRKDVSHKVCFVCSGCIELTLSKLQRDVDIAERPERVEVLNVYVLPVDVMIWRVIYSFIAIERVGTASVCHSRVGRTGRGDGGLKASSGGRGVSNRKLIDESKITSLLLRT